jgi:nucleoside-diphosphate-sugar epimerase
MLRRILFTGGTGKAGRHVLPWLANQGYRILPLFPVRLRYICPA